MRCDSDGVGPFGIVSKNRNEGRREEERDTDWWKRAAQAEATKNRILEGNLDAAKKKVDAESLKLEARP